MNTRITFEQFVATRVWCADFEVAGLPHATEMANGPGAMKGYAYEAGCWIEEMPDGLYWVSVGNDDTIGTLAEVEKFLWDNHASHELVTE